jgi:hypothetical protein
MASTLESPSPVDVEPLDRRSRIYAIRVPPRLQEQIEAVAAGDANTVSSVIRGGSGGRSRH